MMFDVEKTTSEAKNDWMSFGCSYCYLTEANWSKNITGPFQKSYYFNYYREVLERNMNLTKMPGFRLSWNYNEHLESEAIYINDTKTKGFIR